MPPRKRQAKKPAKYDDDAEFQSDDDEDVNVDEEEHVKVEEGEEEEDVKPSKKRKGKAKGSSPKAKGSTPKKPQYDILTKPTETEGGWTLHPPSLIYRGLEGEGSKKVAAFDFDGTLALQKSAAPWPRDEDDWILYNKTVPGKLQELVKDGYRVVIFSNQGGIKTALTGKAAKNAMGRVSNVLDAIDLQLPVMMATNKDQYRKPSTGMWEFVVENGNGAVQPDLSESFFVGDASGAADSFADSDKKFAENIGIDFKSAKDFFGDPDGKAAPNTVASYGLNNDMAQAFRDLAAANEAQGGNAFGIRALNKSADIIAAFGEKVTSGKQLSSLKGIGKGTVAKIDEFLSTGTLAGLSAGKEAGESATTAAADMALKFA